MRSLPVRANILMPVALSRDKDRFAVLKGVVPARSESKF